MRRNALNFFVDGISAVVMLGLVATGLINRFVLPPGSGNRLELWSLGRHDWGEVHFWMAAGAAALLLVHVALHWPWVCTSAARMVRPWSPTRIQPGALLRNSIGAGLLAILIGTGVGLVWIARTQVVHAGIEDRQGPWWAQQDEVIDPTQRGNQGIRGSMTLDQAAGALGISVEALRDQLDLPEDVDPNARLGVLRQQYGFTMSEVRAAAGATAGE